MTTTNLGLDNSLTQLSEGQEQKEAAINSNTTKLLANMTVLDTTVPVFMGEFPSQPSSGTVALGSTYYNTSDSTLYTLRSKSPDEWYAAAGGGGGSVAWGSITGTLSNQTDLQTALNDKADTSHTHVKADITDFSDSDYATAAQGALAQTALQSITGESIEALIDVDSTMTPSEGQVLTYQSGQWTSETPSGGGGGGSSDPYVLIEKPFRPITVSPFAKGDSAPFNGLSGLGYCNLTAFAPSNKRIVNVYKPTGFSTNNTLTFFDVRDDGQLEVISSETTTITGGQARWVDISGTGDRAAVVLQNSGADTIVVLSTSNNWSSYSVEQTINVFGADENITSCAFNNDGSVLWFATGNDAGSGSVDPSVGYFTRSGTTWSFTENAYSAGLGASVNLILMYGQIDTDTVAFQEHQTSNPTTAGLYLYQKSGTWSQLWSKGSTNLGGGNPEADILGCVSEDGNVIFYRTGTNSASIDIDILSGLTTVNTTESLAGSDAPFTMSPDGLNLAYVSSTTDNGRIWFHHRNGTSLEEIGFGSFNYEINRPYGSQQHAMRPAKTGHYYIICANSANYADDAIIAGIPSGQYIPRGTGIQY